MIRVVFIDLDNDEKMGEVEFDSIRDAKLFLEMLDDVGVETDATPYHHSVCFNPREKAFEVCCEE